MLLLRNVNCVSIVQLNFIFIFQWFFLLLNKVTYLITTKDAKKILKLTKEILFTLSLLIYMVCNRPVDCAVLFFQLC